MSAAPAIGDARLVVDAVSELVNIGSASALKTLSQMLAGARVDQSVPTTSIEASDEDASLPGVVIRLAVHGAVPALFILLLDKKSADLLAARLLRKRVLETDLASLAESALLEVGNIMSCAFLDTLARLVGTPFIPDTPSLYYGTLAKLARDHLDTQQQKNSFCSAFFVKGEAINGKVVLLTDDAGARSLARLAGLKIN